MHQPARAKTGAARIDLLVMRAAAVFILFAASAVAGKVERIGTIAHMDIKECSGIVASRQYPGVFWTHNDGKKERLYAIDRKGETVGEIKVTGAKFKDWEDIALDAGNNLYIADTGDNNAERPEVAVYQLAEPNPKATEKSVRITRQWVLRYPLGARDCESIIVRGTNVYLISKLTKNQMAEIFTFRLQDAGAPITLKPLGRLAMDSPATAADLSADGKQVAVTSKAGAFFFDFGDAFVTTGISRAVQYVPFGHESIEACTFVPDGLLVAAETRELFLFEAPAR